MPIKLPNEVAEAYRSGKLNPQQLAELEADLSSGLVEMPLTAEPVIEEQVEAFVLPNDVAAMYRSNQMPAQARADLEADLNSGAVVLPEEEKGFLESAVDTVSDFASGVKKAFTGEDKLTEDIQSKDDWNTMPEMSVFGLTEMGKNMRNLGVTAATVFTGPEETAKIIKEAFPNLESRQDEKGNWIFKSNIDGKEYGIKPGFGWSDVPRAITGALGFELLPAAVPALGTGVIGTGTGMALTSAAQQGLESQMGGEFNPESVALDAAIPMGLKTLGKAKQGFQALRDPASEALEEAAPVVARPQGPSVGAQAGEFKARPQDLIAEAGSFAKSSKKAAAGKDVEGFVEGIEVNPAQYQAAKSLDVLDDIQLDHISPDKMFVATTQLAKSQPASEALIMEQRGLKRVGDKLKKIIEGFGGTKNIGGLSDDIKNFMDKDVSRLKAKGEKLYNQIAEKIPEGTTVNPTRTIEYLEEKGRKMGGIDKLSKFEKGVYDDLAGDIIEDSNLINVYHGTDEIFEEFDRMGQKIPAIGRGYYFTPNKAKADMYGKNIMQRSIDKDSMLDWQNLTNPQREEIKNRLREVVPSERLSGYGGEKSKIFKSSEKEAARDFFKNKQEELKDVFHDRAKPKLFKDGDKIGIKWMETGLDSAKDNDLLSLSQEFYNDIARDLGYKSAKYSDEIAVFDKSSILPKTETKGLPTYHYLDQIRKDVGVKAAAKGPFVDADTAKAKTLYQTLTGDQGEVAEKLGFGEQWKSAKELTTSRKVLEKDMQYLFGKHLDQTIVNKLFAANAAIQKTDQSKFINMIRATPPEMREELVATGFLSAFGKAGKEGVLNFNSFANFMNGLNDNPKLKASIYSNLKPELRKYLDNMGELSNGIRNATSEKIYSGKAMAPHFKSIDTLLGKLLEAAKKSAVALPVELGLGAMGIPPGYALSSAFVGNMVKGGDDHLKNLNKLLISQEFKKLAFEAAEKGKPTEQSVKRVARSKVFRKFLSNAQKAPASDFNKNEKWILEALRHDTGEEEQK